MPKRYLAWPRIISTKLIAPVDCVIFRHQENIYNSLNILWQTWGSPQIFPSKYTVTVVLFKITRPKDHESLPQAMITSTKYRELRGNRTPAISDSLASAETLCNNWDAQLSAGPSPPLQQTSDELKCFSHFESISPLGRAPCHCSRGLWLTQIQGWDASRFPTAD